MTIFKNYKKIKKLIIFSAVPFYNTWPKKWKLDKFKNFGYQVDLWSLEDIFFNSKNIREASKGHKKYKYTDLKIMKIKNFIQLEKMVVQLNTNDLICIINRGPLNNFNFDNRDLDIFNKYKIKYICLHLIPYQTFNSFWLKIKYYFRHLRLRIFNYKNKPSLVIGTGSIGREQVFKIYKNNFIYKSVPSYDLQWTKQKPIIKKSYIVYIDEPAYHSPDKYLFKTSNPIIDIKRHYIRLNKVFEKIEKWENTRIIISTSGKYKYNNNPFNNRKIFYYKTSNLIQNSKFVIGHKSMALHQAIINYKRIILLKDQDFSKLKNNQIDNLARLYGINAISTDDFLKQNFRNKYNMTIDVLNYKKIIRQYLREPQVKGSFINNFISALNQI